MKLTPKDFLEVAGIQEADEEEDEGINNESSLPYWMAIK
jgi:hypothetical protein